MNLFNTFTTMDPIHRVALLGILLMAFGLYYLVALGIQSLAKQNRLFTQVEEGTAKALVRNGQFYKYFMSFMGRDFQGVPDEPPDGEKPDMATVWNIVETGEMKQPFALPFLHGIHWIGFPPFNSIDRQRFRWSSLEEYTDDKGDLDRRPVTKEEWITAMLVQSDTYVVKLPSAECADNIPLDVYYLVTGKITNPYKARYRAQKWLEQTENLTLAKMRDFVGQKHYNELVALKGGAGNVDEDATDIHDFFAGAIDRIKDAWGFSISSIRIFNFDPVGKEAEDFVRASTRLYVAQQQALADEAEGRGLAARDTSHYKAISDIPNAPEMYKWDSIRKSGLSTYVEGGSGVKPTVAVGGSEPPKGSGEKPKTPEPETTT